MKRARPGRPTSLRRSFVLPVRLLKEVREATPSDGPGNLNAMVRAALEDYVARRRDARFAEQVAKMARDPDLRRAGTAIAREFRGAERDGLPG